MAMTYVYGFPPDIPKYFDLHGWLLSQRQAMEAERRHDRGARVTPATSALAVQLVKEAFGQPVADTVKLLLDRGRSTLQELVHSSGLRKPQLQERLKILIQHSQVRSYLSAESLVKHREAERRHRLDAANNKEPPPMAHLYEADLDCILRLLRVPRVLLHIQFEKTSDDEEVSDLNGIMRLEIVRTLLNFGRLEVNKVLAYALEAIHETQDNIINAENATESEKAQVRVSPQDLRSVFSDLVDEHCIERAPEADLDPPEPFTYRSSRRGKGKLAQAEAQADAVRALARIEYEKQRYNLPASMRTGPLQEDAEATEGGVGGTPEPATKKQRISKGSAAAKKGAAQEAPARPVHKDDIVQWRMNWEEFDRRFRHDECRNVIEERYGEKAAHWVQAMLHFSRKTEVGLQTDDTPPISQTDIQKAMEDLVDTGVLPEVYEGDSIEDDLKDVLADPLEFVTQEGSGHFGDMYSVHQGAIIHYAKVWNLLANLRSRFGQEGLRVFRTLVANGQMEQKYLAARAMLEPKRTRELLYLMFKAGFVSLQDIPRDKDHAPSRTIYTWRANNDVAVGQMGGDIYKSALNTRLFYEHHFEANKQLMEKVKKDLANDQDREDCETVGQQLRIVVSKGLAIDRQIALMNDY